MKAKLSISFAPELGDAVREAKLRAEEDEQEAHRRRMQGLGEYLDEYEAEYGAFTEEQLARAARKLGVPWPPEGQSA